MKQGEPNKNGKVKQVKKMATMQMPQLVVDYSKRKSFTRRANKSEAFLKVSLNQTDDTTLALLDMLNNGSAEVCISENKNDVRE